MTVDAANSQFCDIQNHGGPGVKVMSQPYRVETFIAECLRSGDFKYPLLTLYFGQ